MRQKWPAQNVLNKKKDDDHFWVVEGVVHSAIRDDIIPPVDYYSAGHEFGIEKQEEKKREEKSE
jgi:hypothetical protein